MYEEILFTCYKVSQSKLLTSLKKVTSKVLIVLELAGTTDFVSWAINMYVLTPGNDVKSANQIKACGFGKLLPFKTVNCSVLPCLSPGLSAVCCCMTWSNWSRFCSWCPHTRPGSPLQLSSHWLTGTDRKICRWPEKHPYSVLCFSFNINKEGPLLKVEITSLTECNLLMFLDIVYFCYGVYYRSVSGNGSNFY